jgi:hypothetical protein
MKMLPWALCIVPGFLLAAEDDAVKRQALDDVLLSAKLWATPLEDIKEVYEPEEKDEDDDAKDKGKLPKELILRLKEDGFDIESIEEEGALQWLSVEKQGLRSPGGFFSLLGKDVGEVVIRSDGGKTSEVSISVYNRGDDGVMTKTAFDEELRCWKSAMDEKLQVRSDSRDKAGAVAIEGWMWKKNDTAYLLEGSITRRVNRAEFIRIRMAPLNSSGSANTGEVARRGSLEANVKKSADGDVMVSGIPMVDQGQKGYCVVASVERVGRYFGLQVDQHELAQLANTDEYGTNGDDMEAAFKKLTGKIHVRTIKLMDYDQRQFERDYASYNREAKREGVKIFEEDLDEWIIDPRYFWSRADKDVFKTIKKKQAQYAFFTGKVEEYVDQGIPICWTLYLGMFKEDDTPQSWGGHMRLIIGYNKAKEEIIYTDSWGDGHSLKRMSAVEAWCMTMGVYAMVPNR